MSASGNIVNYNIRTCKSVERRMILVTLIELFRGIAYKERRYIGFGSTYFTDFKLFHKELHIDNMISIESEESIIKRVEFNKPFKCITLISGKSTDKLLELEWQGNYKDFVWLDYDGILDYDMFNDIEHIFSNIQPGSIYLMSCNKMLKNYTLPQFNEVFGELTPNNITINDFHGDRDFLLIRKMILNKITETLNGRNYTLPKEQQLEFKQLFFFTYKDGANMLSYGGLIKLKSDDFSLEKYNLENNEFIKQNDKRFIIDPPNISLKESYLLNSCLPETEDIFNAENILSFIPTSERSKYLKLYKFLPNYMDVVH